MQVKTLFPVSPSVKLMVGAVVVSVAGAFTALAQAQPMDGPHGRGHAMAGPMGGGHMIERMLDSVNASADQRTRVRDIMKAAGDDVRKQHEASRGLRDQMTALFTAPTVDARAVEALRQQMLQQHDQTSRRMTQAMLDASAVLTPEQRAQLAEKMKQRRDMMERHQRERRALDPK
jgi:periplasmic protein CpxP/Spy